ETNAESRKPEPVIPVDNEPEKEDVVQLNKSQENLVVDMETSFDERDQEFLAMESKLLNKEHNSETNVLNRSLDESDNFRERDLEQESEFSADENTTDRSIDIEQELREIEEREMNVD